MPYQSITEAANDLRSGLITPTELLEESLERINWLHGEIKAFVTVMRDEAMADAEKAKQEQRTGLFRGQLHGIPIGVKDIMAVRGVRMTAGSKVLADYIA